MAIIQSTGVLETIGGSDLSVFYMVEIPNLADLNKGLPLSLCTKKIITLEFDTALSVSYSTIREKFPVRVLGETNARSITNGIRTISGHIGFNIFTNDVLSRLRGQISQAVETEIAQAVNLKSPFSKNQFKALLLDQLPPFHLLIMGTTERGTVSRMMIKGCSILDENQYQGTQQPNIVNKVSFVALDIVPMTKTTFQDTLISGSVTASDEQFLNGSFNSGRIGSDLDGSSLILDQYYDEVRREAQVGV